MDEWLQSQAVSLNISNTFVGHCSGRVRRAVNHGSKGIWLGESDGVWHGLLLCQPERPQQDSKVLQSRQLVGIAGILVAYFPVI